jgi:hypothetical protein
MSKDIKIEVADSAGELVKEPVALTIIGTIRAPGAWLEKRKEELDPLIKCSHVLVDKQGAKIELVINESSAYATRVTGWIEASSETTVLPINTGKSLSPLALSDLIKLNRYLFASREAAMKLVGDLRSAKSKIDGYIERAKDDRGNYAMVKRQAIDSTIPDGFDLQIPIVRGGIATIVHVEICINHETLDCTLQSPDLLEQLRDVREAAIDEQVKRITEITAGRIVIVMV